MGGCTTKDLGKGRFLKLRVVGIMQELRLILINMDIKRLLQNF